MKIRVIRPEVFSRCSGYFRPISNYNPGKKEEFSERRKLKFELASEEKTSEASVCL